MRKIFKINLLNICNNKFNFFKSKSKSINFKLASLGVGILAFYLYDKELYSQLNRTFQINSVKCIQQITQQTNQQVQNNEKTSEKQCYQTTTVNNQQTQELIINEQTIQQQQKQAIEQLQLKIDTSLIDSLNESRKNLAQNQAIIFLSSQKTQQDDLQSKRLQNFLTLRGIKVEYVQDPNFKERLSLFLCNRVNDCKDIIIERNGKVDYLHHINNFLNPPHQIHTIEQARELIQNVLGENQFLISAYIPQQSAYKPHQPISKFDTYSQKHQSRPLRQIQKQFNQYKYLSSSKNNLFIKVRSKQVAKYLKISDSKLGLPHILYKYDSVLNGRQSQPNCKIQGKLYHSIGSIDRIIEKENLKTTEQIAYKINQLTDKGYEEINFIEDLKDKIRKLNELNKPFKFLQGKQDQTVNDSIDKKLLVVKINDPKLDVQENIDRILEKVSRLNRNQVSIIKTKNQALLKSSILRVLAENSYGTVRLFDINNTSQEQIQKGYVKRYIPKGPFQIQYLSKFIENSSQLSYCQIDKSVNKLKCAYPGDFGKKSDESEQKLILFYKQGCQGCHIMQDLLNQLVDLQQKYSSSSTRVKRQISLKYRIQDFERFMRLQIYKYNILNDDPHLQVPQTTPTIFLFNSRQDKLEKVEVDGIFNQLSRIKNGNNQVVIDAMIRDLIGGYEKTRRKMQQI